MTPDQADDDAEPQEEVPRPRFPLERAADAVHQLVSEDPWVRSLPGRVVVHAHRDAIWLVYDYGPNHRGLPEYRITEPDWWEPLKKGRARSLASRLVVGLRERLGAGLAR